MNVSNYSVLGGTLRLLLPEKLDLLSLQAQVPGIQEIAGVVEDAPRFVVSFINRDTQAHTVEELQDTDSNNVSIVVTGQWNSVAKSDIPHLCYGMLRKYWLMQQVYPVHSLCFGHSLLIGHSGSGKTTLGLEALSRGEPVVSFDKTLIQFNPDKNINTAAVAGTEITSERTNGARTKISRANSMCKTFPYAIKHVYLIFLKECQLKTQVASFDSGIHQLYPFFMDTTKQDVVLGVGSCIYTGDLPKESGALSKMALIEGLKGLLSEGRLITVVGKPEDIFSYVNKLSHG